MFVAVLRYRTGGTASRSRTHSPFTAVSVAPGNRIFLVISIRGSLHTSLRNFSNINKSSGGGVLVQTRDVKDTVLSLKEMIDKIHTKELRLDSPWLVGLNSKWAEFSEEEKLSAVAASYTFWHFDFRRSWRNYSRRIEVDYESATRQTTDVVGEICRFFGLPKSPDQIDEALSEVAGLDPEARRLNRGVSGRGKEILPDRVQEMIDEIDCLMGEVRA